jgi:hypothetical protein
MAVTPGARGQRMYPLQNAEPREFMHVDDLSERRAAEEQAVEERQALEKANRHQIAWSKVGSMCPANQVFHDSGGARTIRHKSLAEDMYLKRQTSDCLLHQARRDGLARCPGTKCSCNACSRGACRLTRTVIRLSLAV